MSTDKILRAIAVRPENRRCFNCGTPVQYVVPHVAIFVCTECSGHHMNIGHRVKSISMGKFTAEEVAALEAGGNAVATRTWLANWKPEGDAVKPVDKNPRKLDAWVRTVFVDKRYYSAAPVAPPQRGRDSESQIPVRPLSDILGSGPGSVKLTVSPTPSASNSPSPPAPPAKLTAGTAAATYPPAPAPAPRRRPTAPGGAAAEDATALKAGHPDRPLGASSFGWPSAPPVLGFTDNAFEPAAAAVAGPAASPFDPFGSFVSSLPSPTSNPAATTATAATAAAATIAAPAAPASRTHPHPQQHPAQQPRYGSGGGVPTVPASTGGTGGASPGVGAASAVSSSVGVGGGCFNDDADWGAFAGAPVASAPGPSVSSTAVQGPGQGQLSHPPADPPAPVPVAQAAAAPPAAMAPNGRSASGGGASALHPHPDPHPQPHASPLQPQSQPDSRQHRTELPSDLFCEPVLPLGMGVGPMGMGPIGVGPMGLGPVGAYPGTIGFGPLVGAGPAAGPRPQVPYPGPGIPMGAGVGQFAYPGAPPPGIDVAGMVPPVGVPAGMGLAGAAVPAPLGAFGYSGHGGVMPVVGGPSVGGAFGGARGGIAPGAFSFGQLGAALPQSTTQPQQASTSSAANGNPFA